MATAVEGREHILVDGTELQIVHTGRAPLACAVVGETAERQEVPRGRRHGHRDKGYQVPGMFLQLVEARIVERRHQLGIDGLTVTVLDGQRPFFLLTGFQSVTERLPLHLQPLVGQRTSHLGRMGIETSVLHPGEGQQQTVPIFLLIGQLQVNELVALLKRALLNDLAACEDAIDDMHIFVGRAHLDGDGFAVVRELGVRLPEPVVGLCGRCQVASREQHEVTADGIVLACSLNRVLAALQL